MERVLRGVDFFFSFLIFHFSFFILHSSFFLFAFGRTDGWINDIAVTFVFIFCFFPFPKWVTVLGTNKPYTLNVGT